MREGLEAMTVGRVLLAVAIAVGGTMAIAVALSRFRREARYLITD